MEKQAQATERTPQSDKRAVIIQAALESLREVGYAGTSTREIARRGGFNAALISYYFGGLHELLLAALDHSSALRMERYSEALTEVESLEEMTALARQIYREDVEGGHITVFTEMVAASLAHRELGPRLVESAEPWTDFIEEAIRKVAGDSPLLQLVPPKELAYAIICFYLGVNLMTQLDENDARVSTLFEVADRIAPLLNSLLST